MGSVTRPPQLDKPVLVYDGDCTFCKLWIERWKAVTEGRLDYAPFQQAAAQFPQIPHEAFRNSVQLVYPDGRFYSAAHAVFQSLALVPGYAWMLWLYQHVPGVAPVTETCYRFVARNRNPLYRLTRVFWGRHFERPSFTLSSWLFLRLIGIAYFFAFLSISTQILGLIGANGILPARDFLEAVATRFGPERYRLLPTLAWLSSSDLSLRAMCAGGVIGSLLVVLDVAALPILVVLWILFLSLVTVGQDFLSFQWDSLLLEAGFLAIFLAPWRLFPRGPLPPTPRAARWLLWFLLFRLMFSSGVVKLTSGDSTWRNLTALEYHYYTQPLPTPIAWYAHLAPAWFLHGSVVFVFFVELAVPFLIFAPRLWRFVGGGLLIFLQILIALTGNYAFFNLLTVALCVMLFDDAFLKSLLPRWLSERLSISAATSRRHPVRRWLTASIALIVFIAGLLQVADILSVEWVPASAYRLLGQLEPLRIVNRYGLFAEMTTSRSEIVIQGSNDGQTWHDYEFKYKPGDPRRAPRWVEPFQPRLDWQMWFAALGDYGSSPWFSQLMMQLLRGSPPVLDLLAHNPFQQAPPKYVRALLYDYQFTDWSERRGSGDWWRRRLLGDYFPSVSLKEAGDGVGP